MNGTGRKGLICIALLAFILAGSGIACASPGVSRFRKCVQHLLQPRASRVRPGSRDRPRGGLLPHPEVPREGCTV